MALRAILLSSVVSVGVMVAAGAASANAPLTPNGNWAVSKVDAKKGSAPYCALARRFSNGSILTFARNTLDETSLALDFPKGTFKTGQDESVVINAGLGESRRFNTKPLSERGIVVRMGRDSAFFTALEKSGTLEVTAGGQNFSYALADMNAGSQDLSACLGPMSEPAAGNKAGSEPVGIVSRASDMVANDGEIQRLREENTRLKNALERERRSFEEQAMRTSSDSSAAAELTEKLRLLEIENKSLRASGAAPVAAGVTAVSECVVSAAGADASEAEHLRAENQTLIQEVNTQRDRIAALEEATDKMAASMTRDQAKAAAKAAPVESEMVAKLSASEKRVSEAERSVAVLQDQIVALTSENDRLKTARAASAAVPQSDDAVKANLATLAKLKTLEDQMAMVKVERDRYAGELESLRNSGAQGRISVAANNWDLEQATKRFNEAEREIVRLGGVMEQERAKCVAEKKEIEYMLFDPKIAAREQIAKLTRLEEELASAKASLTEKNKGRDNEIAALQKRLNEVEGRATQDSSRAASAESRVKTLEQDLASVRSTAEQSRKEQGQAAATQAAALEKQIQDLNQQLAKARETSALAQAEQDRLKTTQSDQVASLQKQVTDLTAQLAQSSQTGAEMAALQSKLTDAERKVTELGALQAKLSESERRIADMSAQLTQAQQKAGTDVAALQTRQAEQDRTIADLNAKLAGATQESTQLKTALQDANQQKLANANQTIAVDTLKSEIASLNRQVDNLENEKAAMQAQIAQINTAAGEARAAARAQQERMPAVEVDRISGMPGKTVSVAAAVPASVAALAAPQAAVISSATSKVKLMSRGDVEGVLKKAGLSLSNGVQDIASAMGPGRVAYRWQTEGVFGTAEQKVMETPQQFDRMVQEYLDKTRSRCTGQFAAVPALIESTAARQVSSYEIACVDNNGGGASAAVVFSGVGQTFTTYAHEASPESMDFAMDARDRVLSTVQGMSSASR